MAWSSFGHQEWLQVINHCLVYLTAEMASSLYHEQWLLLVYLYQPEMTSVPLWSVVLFKTFKATYKRCDVFQINQFSGM